MIIAREKKASNIAEYLIYMFQIEDMIRALNFDIKTIINNVISQFKVTGEEREEIKSWYMGLIDMMKQEEIEKKGHFQFINNIINDLNNFHLAVLKTSNDTKYKNLYALAQENIQEFRKRSKSESLNDIEICINGMYSLFLLRLQKKEISKESLSSFSSFSNLLAYFSMLYRKYENGELEL